MIPIKYRFLLVAPFLVFAPVHKIRAQFEAQAIYTPYTFTTLAGMASSGSADGTGTNARFLSPSGIAADGAGNLYVSDTGNHTIRRITPAGVVTTIAGLAGISGTNDGIGSAARFGFPVAVALDNAGNLYVGDGSVRKVSLVGTNWIVTTIPEFFAFSLAVDGAGNIYASSGSAISKMSISGQITTIAGQEDTQGSADGNGREALFSFVSGMALDGAGNIFVADEGNNTIRRVSPVGTNWIVTTLAGSAGVIGTNDGIGSAASFSGPMAVALDNAENLFISDTFNATVRKLSPAGTNWTVTTIAGVAYERIGHDGPLTGSNAATFGNPFGVAVDNLGSVYVADYGANAIRKISLGMLTTVAGLMSSNGNTDGMGSVARFNSPSGVALDKSGNVFVADQNNRSISKVTTNGAVTTFVSGTGPNVFLFRPYGLAVDHDDNLYVADSFAIRKITPAADVTTLAGGLNYGTNDGIGSAAEFSVPQGVAVDAATNIYVADTYNHTIRKVTHDGVVTTIAGSPGNPGTNNGPGALARFNTPTGIAVDGTGSLYVTDQGNYTIRKLTPLDTNWMVSTVTGIPGAYGYTDGTNNDTLFFILSAIAVDTEGILYVTDASAIRKVQHVGRAWVTTTLAGQVLQGSADGTGGNAGFFDPQGLAVDQSGKLFVADTGNNTMRVGIMAVSNHPPTITCPPPITIECVGLYPPPFAFVGDGDGDPLTVVWSLNGVQTYTNNLPGLPGPPPRLPYPLVSYRGPRPPLGTNILEITVTDSATNSASCSTTFTVLSSPPYLSSVSAEPDVLWPPNHKFVDVQVRAVAIDFCGSATWKIIGVSGDDGSSLSDWQITGDHTVRLRADRSGKSDGRTYTITVQAIDTAGNLSDTTTVTVFVPHNGAKP